MKPGAADPATSRKRSRGREVNRGGGGGGGGVARWIHGQPGGESRGGALDLRSVNRGGGALDPRAVIR
jgi:hypothetical protein